MYGYDSRRAFAEFDRMFKLLDGAFSAPGLDVDSYSPRMDATQDEQGVTLRFDAPGLRADELEVLADAREVTLKVRHQQETREGLTLRHRERARRDFTRTFSLSRGVDAEAVTATLANGTVEIRLPFLKSELRRPVPVTVNG